MEPCHADDELGVPADGLAGAVVRLHLADLVVGRAAHLDAGEVRELPDGVRH